MWENYPFGIIHYKDQKIVDSLLNLYTQFNVPLQYPVAQYQVILREFSSISYIFNHFRPLFVC